MRTNMFDKTALRTSQEIQRQAGLPRMRNLNRKVPDITVPEAIERFRESRVEQRAIDLVLLASEALHDTSLSGPETLGHILREVADYLVNAEEEEAAQS